MVVRHRYEDSLFRRVRIDANGQETVFQHDALGRIVSESRPGSAVSQVLYNDGINPTLRKRIVDGFHSPQTTFEYDQYGRLARMNNRSDTVT